MFAKFLAITMLKFWSWRCLVCGLPTFLRVKYLMIIMYHPNVAGLGWPINRKIISSIVMFTSVFQFLRTRNGELKMPEMLSEASYSQITIKGSVRNFETSICVLRILQKVSKHKLFRILPLVQWKSSAVLKRILKTSNPDLSLYALKLLKSQIPYLGKKWRQSNYFS